MKRSRKYFYLSEDSKLCALYRLGGKIKVVKLAGAEESEKRGRAKRLNDRWINSQRGEVLLPFYEDTRKYSTNLSSRMSPPVGRQKESLTTRKIGNSPYVNLMEHGVFIHTCDGSENQRPCPACAILAVWHETFPIIEEARFDGEKFVIRGDKKFEECEIVRLFRSPTPNVRDIRIPSTNEEVLS
jgi:hypothetical protein